VRPREPERSAHYSAMAFTGGDDSFTSAVIVHQEDTDAEVAKSLLPQAAKIVLAAKIPFQGRHRPGQVKKITKQG